MSFEKLPNEILLQIFKNVNKRSDVLNMCGIHPRIDSVIDTFKLLPKSIDALKYYLPDKYVSCIKETLSRRNVDDLWCIAGTWCSIINNRLPDPGYRVINVFYVDKKENYVGSGLGDEIRFIGIKSNNDYTNLSDFIADVLYEFKFTFDSIAYNHETDNFVTIDRPTYWHSTFVTVEWLEELELCLQRNFIPLTNSGRFGYKGYNYSQIFDPSIALGSWYDFCNTDIRLCRGHIMERCKILKLTYLLMNRQFDERCSRIIYLYIFKFYIAYSFLF